MFGILGTPDRPAPEQKKHEAGTEIQNPSGLDHETQMKSFRGSHIDPKPILNAFPRAESVDLTNDPRIFGPNSLNARLVAFRAISVACVFLTGLSAAQIKGSLSAEEMGALQYAGLVMMVMTFLLNLLALVILLQQIFQAYRLMTSSAIGFDFAKSYYMNQNITKMRHLAVKCFFFSQPLLIASMAIKAYINLAFKHHDTVMGIIEVVVMSAFALLIMFFNKSHGDIFKEKYAVMKLHEKPLLDHMLEVGGRSNLATDC